MKLEYKKDICGNDILQDETGEHQVMMAWEEPYMKKCIEILNPSGDVLEIGFGLGYSAREICKNPNVKSYTIVECSPVVWEKIEEFKKEFPDLTINLIKGRWQDVIDTCGVFDSCFFDDYSSLNQHENYNRANKFLFTFLKNHSNIGSNFVVYSGNEANWDDIAGIEWSCSAYDINIPENCNYVKKYQNKMYVCQVKRIGELDNDLKKNLSQLPMKQQQQKIQDHLSLLMKPKPIQCNLIVIDNFYNNAYEVRKFVLSQKFKVRGNYPGQRTLSFASDDLKNMIETYIFPSEGKIVNWRSTKEENNYNGAYQYTTSRDRSWIHCDGANTWAGVLYMTPNAPPGSGTGFYQFNDGSRTQKEVKDKKIEKIVGECSQDVTKWRLVDKIGNIFNRLILFNSTQYHTSMDYFGTNKENGRLFQVFFFDTEKSLYKLN
tara:strand:- start:200 stop:1498 length:1299 start_codon:yes stop_codon:yes gene_type:complete